MIKQLEFFRRAKKKAGVWEVQVSWTTKECKIYIMYDYDSVASEQPTTTNEPVKILIHSLAALNDKFLHYSLFLCVP